MGLERFLQFAVGELKHLHLFFSLLTSFKLNLAHPLHPESVTIFPDRPIYNHL